MKLTTVGIDLAKNVFQVPRVRQSRARKPHFTERKQQLSGVIRFKL